MYICIYIYIWSNILFTQASTRQRFAQDSVVLTRSRAPSAWMHALWVSTKKGRVRAEIERKMYSAGL